MLRLVTWMCVFMGTAGYTSAQVTGPPAPALTRQATFKDRPVGAIVQKSFDAFANYLIVAAQMMPEAGYSFRPTPDVRTFGEQINHATGANYLFCNQAGVPPGFERRNAPGLQNVTTKSANREVRQRGGSGRFCAR